MSGRQYRGIKARTNWPKNRFYLIGVKILNTAKRHVVFNLLLCLLWLFEWMYAAKDRTAKSWLSTLCSWDRLQLPPSDPERDDMVKKHNKYRYRTSALSWGQSWGIWGVQVSSSSRHVHSNDPSTAGGSRGSSAAGNASPTRKTHSWF